MPNKSELNPCRCGSNKIPVLDSDDMVPCWSVTCYDCKQFQHGVSWNMEGAINKWNQENSLEAIRDFKLNNLLS